MERIKVGILYNNPTAVEKSPLDKLSEEGVLAEVEAVRGVLAELGHEYELIPVDRDINPFLDIIKLSRPDVIFNLTEGVDGDSQKEMCIPALLELLNIPYTGSPALSLGLCLDKVKTKMMLNAAGISTPAYKVASSPDIEPGDLRFPLIVKPAREDASLGITEESVVYNQEKLSRQIARVIDCYEQPALVEEYIEGREFNISILGNSPPQVMPVSELNFCLPPDIPHLCSYKAKWVTDAAEYSGIQVTCPAKISPLFTQRLAKVAKAAYEVMECRDYARVDIRTDSSENIYILEVNPNPDISPDAGLARSVKAAGLAYGEFIKKVLTYAWNRRRH